MLDDRRKTHGSYADFAAMEQALQVAMREGVRYEQLTLTQRSALNMIQHKIARILSGNPWHLEHWRDLAGYAQCAMDELAKAPGATDTKTTLITLNGGTWK